MKSSTALRMNIWDIPIFEHTPLLRFWKKTISNNGTALSSGSIPRHIHGYIEGTNKRTESLIRYFPYKNEITVDGKPVPSFNDILYSHYFPPHLNDDERVKYTAVKTGRTEQDVAEEVFLMKKMKLICAQVLRNKLNNRPMRMPQGVSYSGLERKYTMGTARVALDLSSATYSTHSFDPMLIYSPQYGFAEPVDIVIEKQLRTTLQYLMGEIIVHKGFARARYAQVKDDPKEPLTHIEPCLFEAMKLKMAVCAILAKDEQYVTDHVFDGGHKYGGCFIHLFPDPRDPDVIDNHIEHVELDLELGMKFLKHYYDNYVSPMRNLVR